MSYREWLGRRPKSSFVDYARFVDQCPPISRDVALDRRQQVDVLIGKLIPLAEQL